MQRRFCRGMSFRLPITMTESISSITLDLAPPIPVMDANLPSTDSALTAAPAVGADATPNSQFSQLGLSAALCQALLEAGYTEPTGVQTQAIPMALKGLDLRVASSTGSGKTAAFLLPCLQRLRDTPPIVAAAEANTGDAGRRERGAPRAASRGPRVLVLAPTRELVLQVAKAASVYGHHVRGLKVATVVGGVPYAAQIKALRGPVDVLIATPGRLLDHLGNRIVSLANVQTLVLDEADRMLDMGFIDDIEAIAAETPQARQTLMFSATFAGHVGTLAQRLTHDAHSIEVTSHTQRNVQIEQRLHLADSLMHKNDLLDRLLRDKDLDQAVVFTATQRDADILADRLADLGHAVAALHGGMPQGRRNRVLQALRHGQLRVLVATDVAARGIDVPTITHVINYGMPMKPEDYIHRIGRTGRAGRSGLAVTLAERRDVPMLRRIERFTTHTLTASTLEGLEPKLQLGDASRGRRGPVGGPRSDSRGGPRPHHDGGYGHSERRGPSNNFHGRQDRPAEFAPRGGDARNGGFEARQDPRQGDRFEGRVDHRQDGRSEVRQDVYGKPAHHKPGHKAGGAGAQPAWQDRPRAHQPHAKAGESWHKAPAAGPRGAQDSRSAHGDRPAARGPGAPKPHAGHGHAPQRPQRAGHGGAPVRAGAPARRRP